MLYGSLKGIADNGLILSGVLQELASGVKHVKVCFGGPALNGANNMFWATFDSPKAKEFLQLAIRAQLRDDRAAALAAMQSDDPLELFNRTEPVGTDPAF